MDTAVDAQLGDLFAGRGLNLLKELADGKLFGLSMTGPPCETWTAARHLRCDELHGRGPRPLRSCSSPWRIAGLSLRELEQLHTGSHLMLNSLDIELRISLAGGGAIMEHPAMPDQPDYASIWRTPLHQSLVMQCPFRQLVYIEQWRYGAASVKPTILRGLGLYLGLLDISMHIGYLGQFDHSRGSPAMTAPAKAFVQPLLRNTRLICARQCPCIICFAPATSVA